MIPFADFQALAVGQCGHIALVAFIDVGRPSLKLSIIISRVWPLRCIRVERELSIKCAFILLSALDCGCDWLLRGPAVLISLW